MFQRFKSVLMPVDFSEASRRGVAAFAELPPGIQRHAVHILAPMPAAEPGVVWGRVDDESRKEKAGGRLRALLDEFGLTEVPAHVLVGGVGNPANEIVEFAEELGAELIVMPSSGRSGLARVLLGSVADRVVRLAHCPVLVLREDHRKPA